jgi:secondary thiamine-phosphate synthase enzyme
MAEQYRLEISTRGRGSVEITAQVAALVRSSGITTGIAHVFVRHTSCSLAITENADPTVRADLERLMQRWAPDADPAYGHDQEGDDDMAAHAQIGRAHV